MIATQANIAAAQTADAGAAVAEFAKNSGDVAAGAVFGQPSAGETAATFEERGMIPAAATQVAVKKRVAKSLGPSESGPDQDGVRAARRATLVAR